MAEDETEPDRAPARRERARDDGPHGEEAGETDEAIGATTEFDLEDIRRASAADAPLAPALTVVAGTQAGMIVLLQALPLSAGRSAHCDIVLAGRGISRRHFRLDPGESPDAPGIVDLDSTNGVYVNDVKVRQRALTPADQVRVGPSTVLKFSLEDAVELEIRRAKYLESVRDDLTRTHNRRHFDAALEHEIAYASRHRETLSVLLIDLDHFKRVNDEHGHAMGDGVLRGVAEHFAAHLRVEDLLARYGGEEFAVLLRGQDAHGARQTAERLRRSLTETPLGTGEETVRVTASIGIATLDPAAAGSARGLMAAADRQLYVAKAAGRNRSAGPAPAS